MNKNGWSVLRVWNSDVLNSRKAVLETILAALEGRLRLKMIAADVRFPACDANIGASILNAGAAPHPPFGHLLPVNGEKA